MIDPRSNEPIPKSNLESHTYLTWSATLYLSPRRFRNFSLVYNVPSKIWEGGPGYEAKLVFTVADEEPNSK
jgi:hypothetical protein